MCPFLPENDLIGGFILIVHSVITFDIICVLYCCYDKAFK